MSTTATKARKNRKEKIQLIFPTLEAATAAAQSRAKNPNKVFTVTFQDRIWFITAHNETRAYGIAFKDLGAVISKQKKARKPNLKNLLSKATPEQLEELKKLMGV